MLGGAANGLLQDGQMSTGDDQRRRVDAARTELRKRRAANAPMLSLDDRIQCGSGWRAIVEAFLKDAERPEFVLLSASVLISAKN
jgi:hypothetical protein